MPRRCALAPLAITHLNVLFPRSPSRHPSSQSPTRRPPRRPPPPSTPRRATRRHVDAAAAAAAATAATVPSRFLSLIPRLLTAADVLLSLSFLSFSPAPGEAAMTRVNLPQTPDRYRRTSASLSALLRLFLRPTADNCHPPSSHPPIPLACSASSPLGSQRTPCNEPSTNAGAVCQASTQRLTCCLHHEKNPFYLDAAEGPSNSVRTRFRV